MDSSVQSAIVRTMTSVPRGMGADQLISVVKMNVLSFPTLGVTLFNLVGESILLAKLVEDIRTAQGDGEEDILANSAMERIVAKLMPKSLLHGTPRYHDGSKLFAAVASELELNGTAAAWVPLNACMRLVTARIVDRRGQKYKLADRSM